MQAKKIDVNEADLQYIRELFLKVENIQNAPVQSEQKQTEITTVPNVLFLHIQDKKYFDLCYKKLKEMDPIYMIFPSATIKWPNMFEKQKLCKELVRTSTSSKRLKFNRYVSDNKDQQAFNYCIMGLSGVAMILNCLTPVRDNCKVLGIGVALNVKI